MDATRRRAAIVALAVLEVVLCVGLLAWRVGTQSRVAWAGLTFLTAGVGGGAGDLGTLPGVDWRPRQVLLVVPGSPADRAGLRVGDAIASIQRVSVDQVGRLIALRRTLGPGRMVLYRVERNGGAVDLSVLLGTACGSPAILTGVATSLATGLAFLLVSLSVAWRQPHSPAAMVFFLVSATVAASFFAWGVAQPSFPDLTGLAPLGAEPVGVAVIVVLLLLAVVTANLLLHLALVFPRPRPVLQRWPEVVVWVHTLPLLPLALGLALVGGITAVALGPPGWGLELVTAALVVALLVRLARRQRTFGPWRTLLVSPWLVQLGVVALAALSAPGLSLLPGSAELWAGAVTCIAALLLSAGLILVWTVLTCVALHRGHREASLEEQRQVRRVVRASLVAFVGSAALVALAMASSAVAGNGSGATVLALVFASLSQLVWVLVPVSFSTATRKLRQLETWRGPARSRA